MSLNNLGTHLFNLGRREAALAAMQEAGDIFGGLAQSRPEDALIPYARSLSSIGVIFSALGRREEALAASQEAVDICRRLAQSRPEDDFLSGLAWSLSNLGRRLSDLGRREEALAASQEAVDICRRLAQSRPDALLSDLAWRLRGLGLALAAAERHADAAAAAREGLMTIAPFVERYPQVFRELTRELTHDYLSACKKSGTEPDQALLARVSSAPPRARLSHEEPEAGSGSGP